MQSVLSRFLGLAAPSASAAHCETLESRTLLAGVTLVTHGYQPSGNLPGWVNSMADAIGYRAGGIGTASATYSMLITDTGGFGGITARSSIPLNQTSRGEAIISLDWADASNNFYDPFEPSLNSSQIAIPSRIPFLSNLLGAPFSSPIAELPIHLIGHSRGGAVVDDLSEVLGFFGIWVDHVSYLDAHPLTENDWFVGPDEIDDPISLGNNVLFADAYYQYDFEFIQVAGEPVISAMNSNLTGLLPDPVGTGNEHAGVHAYYHGTIAQTASQDGAGYPISNTYYQSSASGPRSEVGFRYSRLGGGNRADTRARSGLLQELGGEAVRPPITLDPTIPQWPNIANIRFDGSGTIDQSSKLDLSFAFGDRDSASNVTFFLDTDENPYNGAVRNIASQSLAQTSFGTSTVTIDTGDARAGTYYIGAEVTDGTRRRFAYAQQPINLQYRLYFPEGIGKDLINEYVPIVNPNAFPVNYEVILRYEYGERDQIINSGTIPANSRGGPTIYEGFNPSQSLIRQGVPYAIEIRSDGPLGATMSHYDFGVGTGEAFTSDLSQSWYFPSVVRGPGANDFLVWYNPGDSATTVTVTIYPKQGAPIPLTFGLEPMRRGGISFNDTLVAPIDEFAVLVSSTAPIIAAISHYEPAKGQGYISLGEPDAQTTRGSIPFVDLSSTSLMKTTIFNPSDLSAQITLTPSVENGAPISPTTVTVPPRSSITRTHTQLSIPLNRRGIVNFISNRPVAVVSNLNDDARGDGLGVPGIVRTSRSWLFADGYMPNGSAGDKLIEYLSLVNPGDNSTTITVSFYFLDGTQTTTARVLAARSSSTIDLHTEAAVLSWGQTHDPNLNFFGIMVSSSQPIAASMVHWDVNQRGGWQSLGTPFGPLATL